MSDKIKIELLLAELEKKIFKIEKRLTHRIDHQNELTEHLRLRIAELEKENKELKQNAWDLK